MKNLIVILFALICASYYVRNISDSVKKVKEEKEFTQDYKICNDMYNTQKYSEAADCYSNILSKYKRDDMNFIKYNYGASLISLREYDRALKEFEYVAENEKTNTKLINNAKENIKIIKKKKKGYTKAQTKRMDIGDYYSDLKMTVKWHNPKKISVYISADEKQDLYKKAFKYWDESLLNMLDFVYTNNKEEANITTSFADKFNEDDASSVKDIEHKAGYTEYQYFKRRDGNYFAKAKIKVFRYNFINQHKYTDEELYSIILHEIGHAIGLDHSNSKGDIMYFSTDSYLHGEGIISNRDKNTVKKIYGNI